MSLRSMVLARLNLDDSENCDLEMTK